MKDYELFNLIKTTNYKQCGLCANYQVVVNDKEKTIYVLFQESNGKWDWFFNLLYKFPIKVKPYKKPFWKHFKVHFGMKIVYHMMRDEMLKDVTEQTIKHSNYKVIVAGWSHGGAMADLACEDIVFHGICKSPILKTFGGLRVAGNKTTADYLSICAGSNLTNCKSVKYENGSDIVCRVPFSFMGFKDMVIKNHIGERFSWLNAFKVKQYHTAYGDKTLYDERGINEGKNMC